MKEQVRVLEGTGGRLKTGWPEQAAGAWPSSLLPTVPQLAVPGRCVLCRCGETEGLLGAHLKSP